MKTLFLRPAESFERSGWLRLPAIQSRSLHGVALAAILVVAAGLRLSGLNWGLPFPYYPDEPFLVLMARGMLQTGNLNPPDWDYPSLQVYSLLALMAYRHLLSPFLPFLSPESMDYLLGRGLNVVYAVATVYLVYRIGRDLFGDLPGLLSSALLGFSEMHVYNSHVLMTDIPATFYATATLASSIRLARRGSSRDYLVVGCVAGLAIASKYTVGTVLVTLLVAHCLRSRERIFRDVPLLAFAGICALLVFALTSPYAWIDPVHFWQSFTNNDVNWAASGHEGAEGNVLVTYLDVLFFGHDLVIAWLALLGLGFGVIRRNRWVLLVAAFPIVYFAGLLPWEVRFPRYLLPMLPGLSVLAGWAILEVKRCLPTQMSWTRGVLALAAVGLLGVQFWFGVHQSLVFGEEDVRTTALHWVEANLPEGSRIVCESYAPFLPEDRFHVTNLGRAIDHDLAWYRQQQVDYLIVSNVRFGRYFNDPERYHRQVEAYQQLFSSMRQIQVFRGPEVGAPGGEVVIYQSSP